MAIQSLLGPCIFRPIPLLCDNSTLGEPNPYRTYSGGVKVDQFLVRVTLDWKHESYAKYTISAKGTDARGG